MQRTLNEFLVGVLQGQYNAEVVQSRANVIRIVRNRDDIIRKPATYKDLCWYSLTVYADCHLFPNICNNNPQMPKTRYHLYQKKAPKMTLKQKKGDTSVVLNNIVLSFQKATPINYDHNNLFTP